MKAVERLISGILFSGTVLLAYKHGGNEYAFATIAFGVGIACSLLHEINRKKE